MSATAQQWAAARLEIDAATRWTLWTLADFAHDDGTAAFPSVRRIAERTGASERTIRRHLSELLRLRFIEDGDQMLTQHYPANRRPHVWNLRLQVGQRSALEAAGGRPSQPVDNSPLGVSPVTPLDPSRGVIRGNPGVSPVTPKPRTKERTTRAREALGCGQPGCRDPNVGNGVGWLDDEPVTLAPVPCPTCRPRSRYLARFR